MSDLGSENDSLGILKNILNSEVTNYLETGERLILNDLLKKIQWDSPHPNLKNLSMNELSSLENIITKYKKFLN